MEGAEGIGVADDFAGGGEGWDVTEGDGLEHDVTGGGGFSGAGEDGNAGSIGGELIEEIVVAAAADDVETIDLLVSELFDLAKGAAIKERETFEGAANEAAFGLGGGLAGAAAELDELRDHVFGREKFVRGRIDEGGERLSVAGEGGECGVIEVASFAGPLAFAFLEKPESADVFEEADGIAIADFVGEVQFAGGVVDDGSGEFDAHEGPGAGA